MARPLRIEYDGAWYHVMNRGLERRHIFKGDKDRVLFLSILQQACKTFSIEIHAYSLLNNHYHLLVHTPYSGLGRAMRHLNGVYTQKFNKTHKRDGPLFRGRYKAVLVDSDGYLLELVRYIHLNPVKAGICDHPKKHKWTSHRMYLSKYKRTKPPFLVIDDILAEFGRQRTRAAKNFDAFVMSKVSQEIEKTIEKASAMLGSKGFREWVYENHASENVKESREIPLRLKKPKIKIKPKDILEDVATAYNLPVKEILKGGAGVNRESRHLCIYLLREVMGLSLKDIAKVLNQENANTIGQNLYRFRQRLKSHKKLKKFVDRMESTVCRRIVEFQ